MKSRIVFMFVMAAILNPIAVFAVDKVDATKIACRDFANLRQKENAIALENGTAVIENNRIVKKSLSAVGGG